METTNTSPPTRVNKWLILVVATVTMMVDFALLFSLGAIYLEIMETYQTDRATAAVVQSLMTGIALGFGVFSGALITSFGLPTVTLMASVLVPIGFISSFFITNIHVLYITIGIISAIGTSLAHVSSVTIAGRVFNGRHQIMSITILNTAVGIASLGYPYLLSWLTERFGLSGTYLILGGITSNTFLLSIVCLINRKELAVGYSEQTETLARDDIFKITLSSKTSIDEKDETSPVTVNDDTDNTTIDLKAFRREGFIGDTCDIKPELVNDGIDRADISDGKEEPGALEICEKEDMVNITKEQRQKSDDIVEKENNTEKNDIALKCVNVEIDSSKNKGNNKESDKKSLRESLHCIGSKTKRNRHYGKIFVLFKELMTKPYVCLVLAFAFGNISLNGYLGVKIDIAVWKGLNASQGLSSFLAFNCSNIVSRFIPGLLKERKGVNSFFYPIFSAVSGCCGQLLIYFSRHISVYMIGVCCCGIAFGGIVSSSINATVRIVRLELVPIAVGFLISVNGVLIVGVGPLFGAIRDISGSYGSVIITIGSAQAIAAMFYLSAMFLRKRRKEEVIQTELTETVSQISKL